MTAYHVTGPALVSFSGGRTSGFMLHEILAAHGGVLPHNVRVAFANTGKEREETLRFVHQCSVRWGVHVHWLEWRDGKPGFYEVDYNSASRNGEPFAGLIAKKKRLPNWRERWCTQNLKITPLNGLAAAFGWKSGAYTEVIGLRYDEGHRILKGLANAEKYSRTVSYPLSKARITKADVLTFWRRQEFDLELKSWEGNCDLCFMKGRAIKKAILRRDASRADWWIAQESSQKGNRERAWFDRRDSVASLLAEVRQAPDLFDFVEDEEYDAECGLHCSPEEVVA
jgi:3'-phosphoadenosine 5'-phosphosulfate sulfotransferase (PAPS reductase)/FAD synthetase